jgi:hypothetical protein
MSNLGNPSQEVQTLIMGIGYARDRVLQGDWTPKYANEQVAQQANEAEQMLVFFGCTDVDIYAHLSPSGRALLKWSYRDKDGELFYGTLHPTSQS